MFKTFNCYFFYMSMSFLCGCSGSLFESEHIELAKLDNIKKGQSQWVAELDDSVGPMWEISFGGRGFDISDFIDSNTYADCAVELKLFNPNEYSIIAVSIDGKRILLDRGEEYILFHGNLSALSYESSRGFVFRGYDKPQGIFKINVILTSSCFFELDKSAVIEARRSGK